jgi:tRNA threonylcarbamoyladenosine biosynthesis protein TsaE
MEIISTSTSETKDLAGRIAKQLVPGDVLALYGNLAAGKTTFTGFLVSALGINSRVQSPTFVLLRTYRSDTFKDGDGIWTVNHLDLYRLETRDEVLDIGLLEIFDMANSIAIIEWPEVAEDLLPSRTKRMYFEVIGPDKICIKY